MWRSLSGVPELPDIELYLHVLEPRIVGQELVKVRMPSFSLLKTFDPPISAIEGNTVTGLRRIGKRIVWEFPDELFAVFHLMISGRFQWRAPGAAIPKKRAHAAFDFADGTLLLTEASTKKRASLHIVRGEQALADHDRGGLEPLDVDLERFSEAIRRENRTLKRALTNPKTFSGIGNAYSDEIFHAAKISPIKRTSMLTDDEVKRLFEATVATLTTWRDRLIDETGDGWPDKITAFRPDMAVHGKFEEPCPVCGHPVQRIRYANNETNYCATCQTDGKLLADRALSRILKDDWPKTLEEWEG